jgi:tripartite-type tricarboxylate transporter receptor subunit TctC
MKLLGSKINRRTALLQTAVLGVPLLFPDTGIAQQAAFPQKSIRMLVGFPPGGAIDVVTRAVCVEASKKLGQSIVIENRSGASGSVAYTALKQATPDGYTLAPVTISAFRAPVLEDVQYDPLVDFQYLAGITDIPFGVVVNEKAPWRTWPELLAYGRANPEKMVFGCSGGLGNTSHLFVAEAAAKEGLKGWTPIPYRGTADCMQALLGEQILFTVDTIAGTAGLIKSCKLKLLAVATASRLPSWPQVPTMKELGSSVSVDNLWGFAGPKGLDPRVASTLELAFKFAMEQPALIAQLALLEQKPLYTDGNGFRRFAEQSVKEQREVLTKYGFAKKS